MNHIDEKISKNLNPTNEKPIIGILPYELRYSANLESLDIKKLVFPLAQPDHRMEKVADLRSFDHLIVYCCWKSISRSYRKLKCNVDLLIAEPRAVQARYYFLIPFIASKFRFILTHSTRLISKIHNGIFHSSATLWVDSKYPISKKFLISIIASSKKKTEGQRLRHEIIKVCKAKKLEVDFFGSAYKKIDRKEEALADYMFSVCIENSSDDGYFSEKLMDCFALKSIPIYWGAPNIGDYFDINGIIFCKSAEEILSAIHNVNLDLYRDRLESIEYNYKLVQNIKSTEHIAASKITLLIDEKNEN